MIKNKKQLGITNKEIRKFTEALELIKLNKSADIHPLLIKAQIDSIQSQIDVMSNEVKTYTALEDGLVFNLSHDITDLSLGIIEGRISAGLSHKDLADLLGLKEQQIQKYESENYLNTSYKKLLKIIEVLKIEVSTNFIFRKKPELKFKSPFGINVTEIQNKIRTRGTTVAIQS